MKSLRQIREELRPYYTSKETIAKLAYGIWEEKGKPDGEQIDPRFGHKIKEIHWLAATSLADVYLDLDAQILYDFQIATSGSDRELITNT